MENYGRGGSGSEVVRKETREDNRVEIFIKVQWYIYVYEANNETLFLLKG